MSLFFISRGKSPDTERTRKRYRVRLNMEGRMKGFVDDIEELTKNNTDFRRVLYTAGKMQLVLMALQPGEDTGAEVHDEHDQFFRIERGKGKIWIDGVQTKIKRDMAVIVPAGARHNVKNTGKKVLKLYTIYATPEHAEGTVHATKPEADESDEHFDGHTTERQTEHQPEHQGAPA